MAEKQTASPRPGAVLNGQSSPKLRSARDSGISERQVANFFETLAETCNVTRSAEAAGFAVSTAYRRRKTDAAFRRAWTEAVREGYAKLELVLLERAIDGTPKTIPGPGGSERVVREYSTALAIALLKRHADLADVASYDPPEDELAEIRERILGRLDKLREREGE